jgi:type II secretory pathway component PulJ
MSRLLIRLSRNERGMALLELSLAGLISAMIIGVMVVWAGTTINTETHLEADDDAAQDLRMARENLSKDLRRAEEVFTAEFDTVAVWIDENRNGSIETEERIRWSIDEAGTLSRATGTGTARVDVTGLDTDVSGFTYDASAPDEVRNVDFVLTLHLDQVTGADNRAVTASVHIRNS